MYVVKKLKIMGRSYRTVLFPAPVGPITLEHGILEYLFNPATQCGSRNDPIILRNRLPNFRR